MLTAAVFLVGLVMVLAFGSVLYFWRERSIDRSRALRIIGVCGSYGLFALRSLMGPGLVWNLNPMGRETFAIVAASIGIISIVAVIRAGIGPSA